jgi:hypothetical protein
MSLPGSPRLDIQIRERRAERWVASGSSVLALLLPCLLVPAGGSVLLALAAGLGAAAVVAAGFYRAAWWPGPHRIERVIWDQEGYWFLMDASGRTREVQLAADTRLGPGCVWLHWHTCRPHSLLLMKSDLPADQLRRLSVRLRMDRRRADAIPRAAI